MRLLAYFSLLLFSASSWADCVSSLDPMDIGSAITEISGKLKKSYLCQEFKKYGDSAKLRLDLKTAQKALFHTAHVESDLTDTAREAQKDLDAGRSFGLPPFFEEGNAFLVKDSLNKVHLVTARHVTREHQLGRVFIVGKEIEDPIVLKAGELKPNPKIVEFESSNIKEAVDNDIAIIDSPKLAKFVDDAPGVRTFDDPLLVGEPAMVVGYQGKEIKSFSCVFIGYSEGGFSKGIVNQFFKCDNKTIGFGGISGGIVLDRTGKAVGVFDGITYSKRSERNHFLIATPLFQNGSGEIVPDPAVSAENSCMPCFSDEDPDAFNGILSGSNASRSSCLIHKDAGTSKPVFEVLK